MRRVTQRVTSPLAPVTFADAGGPVAVVGLGKIGLPLAVQYARHGRRVMGCDVNLEVVDTVNRGHSHVREEPMLETAVSELVERGLLSATLDTSAAVREARVVVVIVPVLVNAHYEVDYTAIDAATTAIGVGLTPGTLVVYETTLPVGTTAGRLRGILERTSGLTAGQDFLLAYSPERVSSGTIFHDLETYPKIVGGIDAASTAAVSAFYRSVLDAEVRPMASANDAEFVKLIETTYRDVNIALANEFARYADHRGLDAAAAIASANTQPYSHIHEPGIGVGGHCIPVYPYFLMDGTTRGLDLPRRARAINDEMAAYAVERLEAVIGPLAGKAVLILGIAYRGDVREHAFTSAKLLQAALVARGARVFADDPLFTGNEIHALGYAPFHSEVAHEVAAIVLQASHQAYRSLDFRQFPHCGAVLDGRRALGRTAIERAGIQYVSIGDGGQRGHHVREELAQ